jgi:hypothetical protein
MNQYSHAPTKEEVRRYMQQRQAEHLPPPDLQQIRRQLGWELAALAQQAPGKR